MASVTGQAALAAAPALVCTTLSVRISLSPGSKEPCNIGQDIHGPIVPAPWVTVPAVTDGIYDS